jgi:hypothetical protein
MEIIQRSQRIQVERYALDFEWTDMPGAGFSFPCDKDGNLLMDEIPETARENLEKCLSGEYAVTAEGVRDCSYSYFQAAVGKCACGQMVTLEDPLTNTCECGREYNSSAQLLAPRSQWEEVWDEDDPFEAWGYGELE